MRHSVTPAPSVAWSGAIFLVALATNVFRLRQWVPLPDEVAYAGTATAWLTGGAGPEQGLYGFEPVLVGAASLLQRMDVTPLASVRLVAALFGAGVIVLTYVLLRTSVGEWPARGGALAMLALYQLHVYSRVGQRETAHIFFGLLAWAAIAAPPDAGRERFPPGRMIAAGLVLGAGLWTKQVAFLYVITAACLVAIDARWSLRRAARPLAWLAAGLVVPAAAIVGRTITVARVTLTPDMNMPSLGAVAGAKFAGASIITMLGIPVFGHKLIGVVVLIAAAGCVVQGCLARRPMATLAAAYLVPACLFFTLLPRKHDYYMLPCAMVLLLALVETASVSRRAARAVAAAALVLLAAFNVPAARELYATRGPGENFLAAMRTFDRGRTIASSHAELVAFINQEERLDLRVLPLFEDPVDSVASYRLNAATLADPRLDGIVLKDYYYDRLRAAAPDAWSAIGRRWPAQSRGHGLVVLRRDFAPPH
jgi:hypothetical protein